jgi:hypothetical protein
MTMHDILTMPVTLVSLDDLPDELRGMYAPDQDGLFVLTEVARENIGKVASGIQELAAQRDEQAARAQAALLDAQIMAAVLINGAVGVLAAGAAAQLGAENKIAMRAGKAVVETDGGDVGLDDYIREWMVGPGAIFISNHKTEKRDDYFARQLR